MFHSEIRSAETIRAIQYAVTNCGKGYLLASFGFGCILVLVSTNNFDIFSDMIFRSVSQFIWEPAPSVQHCPCILTTDAVLGLMLHLTTRFRSHRLGIRIYSPPLMTYRSSMSLGISPTETWTHQIFPRLSLRWTLIGSQCLRSRQRQEGKRTKSVWKKGNLEMPALSPKTFEGRHRIIRQY